jgi:hypothetical protein
MKKITLLNKKGKQLYQYISSFTPVIGDKMITEQETYIVTGRTL